MTETIPSFRFDTGDLKWIHYEGSPRFDYPIDYDIAVLGHQEDLGRLDLLIRWAPESYCHFHRHVATTTSLVLEGEHHIIDIDHDGNEVHHDVRPVGTYCSGPGGDMHMERGGPEGSLVLFSMQEPTGRMFDVLDAEHNLLAETTIESFKEQAREFAS